MGKVALMAVRASEVALENAGLAGSPELGDGRTGVAYGSSAGSPPAIADFGNMIANKSTRGLNATSYIRMMGHTTPVNIGIFFGLKGRVYTTSSACTSGSQGIGNGYEAIKYGLQDIMICGGAEELCASEAAVFDILFATSTKNETPELTPRPFDKDRDGLVVGEGAATLVLEEMEHARRRGAPALGEILGYGTNSDGTHITRPDSASMANVMRLALKDATPENSCLYFIPKGQDKGYLQGDGIGETDDMMRDALRTKNTYQHIRAVPLLQGKAALFPRAGLL